MTGSRTGVDRAVWITFVSLVVATLILVGHRVLVSPAGRVIFYDPDAPWIMVDRPPSAKLQQWGRARASVERFVTTMDAQDLGMPPTELTIRTFGASRVWINGAEVAELAHEEADANWKRRRSADVSKFIKPGKIQLRVDVANTRGPALLSLRLDGPDGQLAIGLTWVAFERDGTRLRTRLADDSLPLPDANAGERPLEVLAESLPLLFGLMAIPIVGLFVTTRFPGFGGGRAIPAIAFVVVVIAWLVLFALKLHQFEIDVGLDAKSHFKYIQLFRETGKLPLATDHWQTYQPPLFYLATVAVEAIAGLLGAIRDHPVVLKSLPFLAGLGNVALAGALVHRLLPGDHVARTLAILFAGFLPVNLWVAAYFSNEGLHSLLAGGALVLAVSILLDEGIRTTRLALLSLVLGLALLTKFTAILVAAPVLLGLALKIFMRSRRCPRSALIRFGALLLPMFAVAGWFYLRNVLVFGRPIVGNWEPLSATHTWWSQPGFHTPNYYLSFGESLIRPYFSGFVSFWDSLYSTFWADGFLGGKTRISSRHPFWNYPLMAAGLVLALPATVALFTGFIRTAIAAWSDTSANRRAAFGLIAIVWSGMAFAAFWVTLGLPYYGQARISYLLAALPAWSLFFAWPISALDQWLHGHWGAPGRALLFAWLGALFGTLYLGFSG